MTPHLTDALVTLYAGDCLDVLRELPDASVDAVVTDPPYGLSFMGKEWDRPAPRVKTAACVECGNDDPAEGYTVCTDCLDRLGPDGDQYASPATPAHGQLGGMLGGVSANWHDKGTHSRGYADNDNIAFGAWCLEWTAECLRVLKPGGHLLAFGGTRTWHRLACAVEDAGFEVRDSIAWLYGSGFPKSLDVSKAIDKAAGAEREVVGLERTPWKGSGASITGVHGEAYRPTGDDGYVTKPITAPATDAARTWQGWGTALKPAFEPVVVARKPLTGTVAATVLAHGTGALNIDATRIATDDDLNGGGYSGERRDADGASSYAIKRGGIGDFVQPAGRWPANVVLDDTQAAALDEQSGQLRARGNLTPTKRDPGTSMFGVGGNPGETDPGDKGGASRFFFTTREDQPCPNLNPASTAEPTSCPPSASGASAPSGASVPGVPLDELGSRFAYVAKAPSSERPRTDGTAHPTVKPLALMRWLVRLVTPPGGTVLEPFAGSGTTVEAAILEGFHCVAIEREADYLPLIEHRIERATRQERLFF